MKLSIRTLNLVFSISLLLLISAFIYSYLNIQGLRAANQSVIHTNAVILRLESIYSNVKNNESGVRGYVLTKDASHISQQGRVISEIKMELNKLDSLTADNPRQQIYVDTLRKMLNDRFFLFNGLINLANNDADEESILSMLAQGKTSTDHINVIVQIMKQNEEVLLTLRNQKMEELNRNAPLTILSSGILGFFVLVLSYIFILRHLRVRNRISNELKSKNTLLEYVQQITQMGSFEYNIHTNTLTWSNEMYTIFEMNKNTSPQLDFIDTLIVDESKTIHGARKRKFELGGNYSEEFKIRTASGKEKILLSNGYSINKNGVIVVYGAIIDITALKKAELTALEQQQEMKLAKEKAESASQFKTRYLSNMSHEIRTPINAILGFSRILSTQEVTLQQKELLKNITISGELLLKLIGNILDISKIEEGKVLIERKIFHFKENIRSVLSPFNYAASEKGLGFSLLIDEQIPNYVLGDAPRVTQVLVNLIGNALKFTKQGKISVKIELQKKVDEIIYIDFSVSDTGIGIEKEKQHLVFESFTQANESISTTYGGTGLGLAIVDEVVSLMGGKIVVQSPLYTDDNANGYGTAFLFTLPFTISLDVKSEPANDKQIQQFSRGVHVLLADDNEMNRKLGAYTLQALGCTFDIVENGLEAVQKVSTNKYDIILMDMQMPICDGLSATRQIRATNTIVPIIGLTANVFQEDIDACLNAGMDAHLGKPYTDIDLYLLIDTWVFQSTKTIPVYSGSYCQYTFVENLAKRDIKFYKDFLEMLYVQNNTLSEKIELAFSNSDFADMAFQLHQYKSCVRMLEVDKQSVLISELERIITHTPSEMHVMGISLLQELMRIGAIISEEIQHKISIL